MTSNGPNNPPGGSGNQPSPGTPRRRRSPAPAPTASTTSGPSNAPTQPATTGPNTSGSNPVPTQSQVRNGFHAGNGPKLMQRIRKVGRTLKRVGAVALAATALTYSCTMIMHKVDHDDAQEKARAARAKFHQDQQAQGQKRAKIIHGYNTARPVARTHLDAHPVTKGAAITGNTPQSDAYCFIFQKVARKPIPTKDTRFTNKGALPAGTVVSGQSCVNEHTGKAQTEAVVKTPKASRAKPGVILTH